MGLTIRDLKGKYILEYRVAQQVLYSASCGKVLILKRTLENLLKAKLSLSLITGEQVDSLQRSSIELEMEDQGNVIG